MYRKNYRDGEISLPKNYCGNAFPVDDAKAADTCTEGDEHPDIESGCDRERTDGICASREQACNSADAANTALPILSAIGDNGELLLLFIAIMLYTDGAKASHELLPIILFLLCMK